ncbi:transcription termination/antitermination protein NusG [Bradyrhizobium sp. HKCCYLRH1073]
MRAQSDSVEPRPDQCYFVLLAEPKRELTAQANLRIRRVPFYLPTIFRAARISAKAYAQRIDRPDVALPLFPRMLFVAEDVVGRMLPLIRTAPGMQSSPFLIFGERAAVVRPLGMQVIQTIETREREKFFARRRKSEPPSWLPEIGQDVKFLLDDVLGGFSGKVSDVDDKGRLTILTEIMKRTVRVHATVNQVEPV